MEEPELPETPILAPRWWDSQLLIPAFQENCKVEKQTIPALNIKKEPQPTEI